jgi:hypothetical protein
MLQAVLGKTCNRIDFVGMEGCEEGYPPSSGERDFHEVTWGLVAELGGSSLGVTWTQDRHGDPNRIAIVDGGSLRGLGSAVAQDVSSFRPWSELLGSKLVSARVHTYETNYRTGRWYSAPWGLELGFDGGVRTLVAAIHHGDWTGLGVTADEIVVIWSEALIDELCRTFNAIRNEWRAG